MTRRTEFYKRLFQCNIEGQTGKRLLTFPVPIGNVNETGETEFHNYYPTLKYQQDDSNSCSFGILASALHAFG